jgi:hypothetical protein
MAAWIAEKGDLGAFKGLNLLGFKLEASDALATCAAFLCMYIHLDENLSPEDKKTLDFGVIFLEHLLCKVQCWTSRYDGGMRQSSFQALANELIQHPQQNPQPHEEPPFPIEIMLDKITAVIEATKVRSNPDSQI